MKFIKTLCFALGLLLNTQVFSHGDHHHGPSGKNAPKGGRMLETEDLHIELVTRAQEIKIYIYDEKMKPFTALKDLKASLTTQLPRAAKLALEFQIKEDHLYAKFDKGAAHRFILELTITHGGHSDTLNWTIE